MTWSSLDTFSSSKDLMLTERKSFLWSCVSRFDFKSSFVVLRPDAHKVVSLLIHDVTDRTARIFLVPGNNYLN